MASIVPLQILQGISSNISVLQSPETLHVTARQCYFYMYKSCSDNGESNDKLYNLSSSTFYIAKIIRERYKLKSSL